MYSVIAQAMLTPSNVLVPRPTSSKIMRLRGGVIQDICRLIHFHHKGTLPPRKFIRGAYPCKNSVYRSNDCFFCRDKTPHLCHENKKRYLANIRAFPRHIWPGNYHDRILSPIQIDIVGYKAFAGKSSIQYGVTSVDYF